MLRVDSALEFALPHDFAVAFAEAVALPVVRLKKGCTGTLIFTPQPDVTLENSAPEVPEKGFVHFWVVRRVSLDIGAAVANPSNSTANPTAKMAERPLRA